MSSSGLNEEFILAERPNGDVTSSTFKKQTVPNPNTSELKDGQVVAKLLYASVDPYMRGVMRSSEVNAVHYGYGVAEIVASKSSQWKVGEIFFDSLPWRRFTIFDIEKSLAAIRVDKEFLAKHRLSPSVYLSALGMVSRTAYFGIREVLQIRGPSRPLTVVVSGAAGATGGLAVQYARLLGATTVIGIAGGAEKCDYVVRELGADAAVDYKQLITADALRARLRQLAPNGVDRYFDNTGGPITDAIFDVISKNARIAVCGQIALYNDKDGEEAKMTAFLHKLLYTSATVQGYYVLDYADRNQEFFKDVMGWLVEGKIKDKQHIVNGFDQIPKAFMDLFAGVNTGKIIIDCTK